MSVESTVIIPTLNDAPMLGTTVERLNRVLTVAGAPAEVLVVDAGSTDGTLELAADLADRYPLLHMRVLVQDRAQTGFGAALRLGLAYSWGRYCVFVMPDARDPLELIPRMLGALRGGAHLVLCSRYEATDRRELDLPRRFVAYQAIYRRAIRMLLGVDIADSTYGFRAVNRTFIQALGLSARRFAVCPEMTFKVLLAGGRTVRVPGVPSGPMVREQSKFRLGNELGGYAWILIRAALHRLGLSWF